MSSYDSRLARGLGGEKGTVVCSCGRTCSARASIDTGVCGVCSGMDDLQPGDVKDLVALGVIA